MKAPALVILDEPTNGLDPQGMRDMRNLIRELGDRGHTVILSSHMLSEVQEICDRVAVIHRGLIIVQGTVAELRGRAELELTVDPLEAAEQVLHGLDNVGDVHRTGARTLVVTSPMTRRRQPTGRWSALGSTCGVCAGSSDSSRMSSSTSPDPAPPPVVPVASTGKETLMSDLLAVTRAETSKLARRPAVWVLLGTAVALSQSFGFLVPYISYRTGSSGEMTAGSTPAELLAATLPDQVIVNTTAAFPVFTGALALVLGALVTGGEHTSGEHTSGTLKTLLTQGPGRVTVVQRRGSRSPDLPSRSAKD